MKINFFFFFFLGFNAKNNKTINKSRSISPVNSCELNSYIETQSTSNQMKQQQQQQISYNNTKLPQLNPQTPIDKRKSALPKCLTRTQVPQQPVQTAPIQTNNKPIMATSTPSKIVSKLQPPTPVQQSSSDISASQLQSNSSNSNLDSKTVNK